MRGHRYPLLFATISGAHLYGFPSLNSDWDLRGVHILPAERVLGLCHIVGAAMLTRIDTKSKLLGYPSVAIVCFLAAALAGVALILNSVLHDLPQRRRRH